MAEIGLDDDDDGEAAAMEDSDLEGEEDEVLHLHYCRNKTINYIVKLIYYLLYRLK